MSFLDTASSSRTWLPILGILEEDPYRSRNTLANARSSHRSKQYRESTKVMGLDGGAVFDVSLYRHPEKGLFAVKKTKQKDSRDDPRPRGGARRDITNSIVIALREIQVGSHAFLQEHSNIIDMLGWDWDEKGAPVVFTAYAEEGTLKKFLGTHPEVSMYQRRLFALDIACGLHALHMADIAHGDVKLANTLVFPARRENNGWIVKVSDFSHSVFGISSRRSTTYPGSRLYNAPEVRRRDATIPSDRLPRCESFSYGLLAWELLKNGEPYPDSTWIRAASSSQNGTGSDSINQQDFLDSLKEDGLLNLATSFLLSRFDSTSRYDYLLFGRIFEITLRDNPKHRADMQAIAMSLDYCDSADIVQLSRTLNASILSISVWDFNPWDAEPWASKIQFVRDIESILTGPLQPNHAELHLLMSRCYAEGYGVSPDMVKATNHLNQAASFDSLEANWLTELCKQSLAGNLQLLNKARDRRATMTSVVGLAIKGLTETESGKQKDFIGSVRRYNLDNIRYAHTSGFTLTMDGASIKYTWAPESVNKFCDLIKQTGKPLCDAVISISTFQMTTTITTFLEASASLGREIWSLTREAALWGADEYTDTSFGNLGEFYFRLLIAAAKAGQSSVLLDLVDRIITPALNKGAEITFESPTGESPLHYLAMTDASLARIDALIAGLVKLGFDLNQCVTVRSWMSPYGIELFGTPLQVAIRFRCAQTVAALVNAGADVSLGYHDSLPPLPLATSLGCDDIVEFLIPLVDQSSPGSWTRAIKALGIPSRKGWYDFLVSDASSQFVGCSLLRTVGMYLRYCRRLGNDVEKLYEEVDGSPLVEAVSRGQRNTELMATLIEMGFYPRTPATRWKLLESALSLSTDDPFRGKLLTLLFCRREIERAGIFKRTPSPGSYSHACTWIEGWPGFLLRFRHLISLQDSYNLPLLHLLVKRDDEQAISLILAYYPYLADGVALLSQVDHLGHDPGRAAYRRRQMAIHRALRKNLWTFGRHVDTSYRGFQLRRVSQASIDEAWQRRHPPKTAIARPQQEPFRLRLGPISRRLGLGDNKPREPFAFEKVLDIQPTIREFEERIAGYINNKIGNLQIAETVEEYAVWVLQHEQSALTKAEELCVLANILRMEVREASGTGAIATAPGKRPPLVLLDRSDASNWSAPAAFRQLYAKSVLRAQTGGSSHTGGDMILNAYKRLEDAPPRWIRNIEEQTNQTGPEAVFEWFRDARFR
ncbi:hypothetical protein B0H66DRAFT_565331 [Apodospora peruviana]|uniref:Protein kinase domain-containing protein n=1 Tax=Apodospora peruviana TaxID=516989 RepID=A0AAE0I0L9_9PEZI|nr:hypothetical protein B0H66DRAFT_565331 [Apodospora peruviana]